MFEGISKTLKNTFSWNHNQYDAISPKQKRRRSGSTVKSPDHALGTHDRQEMMESARDINRNFAAGAFMVRKHLDYVSSFSFQYVSRPTDSNPPSPSRIVSTKCASRGLST